MLVRRSLKVEVSHPILPKAFLSNTLALQCEDHKVYDLPDFQAHTLHSLNNKPCCVADGPELRSILPVAGPSLLYWRRGSNGGFRTVGICQRFVLGFRQAMVGASQYRPQNTIILSIATPESTLFWETPIYRRSIQKPERQVLFWEALRSGLPMQRHGSLWTEHLRVSDIRGPKA